ncbi:MAG: NADPH:quinone oxidoreductase family protein [Pseudomonadota bacterium]
MRAIVCQEHGSPSSLQLLDVAEPEVGAGDVKIAVDACGINFPDVLMVAGRYQMQPPLPFSPGAEIAGRIVELGSDVERFKVGDRVGALLGYGGLAEFALAKPHQVYPIPEGVPAELAAAFTLAYGTSYHALHDRGRLASGETLLVLGAAGGVGLAAVQLGHAAGASVIAAASSDEKLALAAEHGATKTINYSRDSLREQVKALTDGRGVDVVYDPVGGELTEAALRSLAWGGRLLVIGFAAGNIPTIAANLLLLKGSSAVGVFWGRHVEAEPDRHRNNMAALQRLLAERKIRPVVQSPYPLAAAADALTCLAERRALGKLVVKVS